MFFSPLLGLMLSKLSVNSALTFNEFLIKHKVLEPVQGRLPRKRKETKEIEEYRKVRAEQSANPISIVHTNSYTGTEEELVIGSEISI